MPITKGATINNQTIQTNWSEVKQKLSSRWSKFTDVELESFKDNLDRVASQVQKTYGIAKEQAEKEYHEFKEGLESAKESVKAHIAPIANSLMDKKAEQTQVSPSSKPQVNAMVSEGGPASIKK